ncbi:MAG: carbohydrate-binding family 9-like protein [Fibromonadales bacterium]|nr:carbohydrate-binding family 9-like protein [Fibromonadales bacterium]
MHLFYLRPLWKRTSSVSVGASVEICAKSIAVNFAVKEAQSCFCQNKEQDGEPVWQDSCVEVFLRMLDKSNGYANFEFNSKGVCYAARGKDRQNRTELSKDEYAQIIRVPSGISMDKGFYRWVLSVQIPFVLLGSEEKWNVFQLDGNLYKCADLAEERHWLSAFQINTPEPDFHRPEFFCSLNPG